MRVFTTLVGLLLLTGCSPVAFKKLDNARTAVAETRTLYVIAKDPEIDADVESFYYPSNLGTMGAIPALLDSAADDARAKEQADLVAPLRNALLDYDFSSTLENRVRAHFERQPFGGPKEIVVGDPRPSDLEKPGVVLDRSVLVLEAQQAFAFNFAALRVELTATMAIPRPNATEGRKVDAYTRTYISEFPLRNLFEVSESSSDRASLWLEEVDVIPSYLQRGIDECLAMFSRDLEEALATPDKPGIWWFDTQGARITGRLIERSGDRAMFRVTTGSIGGRFIKVDASMIASRLK